MNTTHGAGKTWGVLQVGHGTRNENGQAEFSDTAAGVAAAMTHLAVEPCFLQFAEPDISTGVERLTRRRVDKICVMPLLLLAADHVKRDIPAAVMEAVARHNSPAWCQAAHLGCHELLVQLSAQRYQEALADRCNVAQEKTLLLFVGHGNRDPAAIAEMHRFAELRSDATPVGRVQTCFLAMARPSLERGGLPDVARSGFDRVVVQPHLLFAGRMLARVRERVQAVAASQTRVEWIVTGHLGASGLLTRAIVDLVQKRIGTE